MTCRHAEALQHVPSAVEVLQISRVSKMRCWLYGVLRRNQWLRLEWHCVIFIGYQFLLIKKLEHGLPHGLSWVLFYSLFILSHSLLLYPTLAYHTSSTWMIYNCSFGYHQLLVLLTACNLLSSSMEMQQRRLGCSRVDLITVASMFANHCCRVVC
jgi:hypothetical protein